MSESDGYARRNAGDIDRVRAEALDVLHDAFSWKLAGERWQEICRILATMAEALESGNLAGLADATADLELAGPLRIIPVDTAGPPPPVRDLLNKLVHAIGGVTTDQRPQAPADSGAPDRDSPGS
jgi:hypothetical protein